MSSTKAVLLTDDVIRYILASSSREPQVLARLREVTAPLAESAMQIGPEEGQFLALLVRLIGARRCIEIGTFTGYSALAVALALPEDGRLFACDVSKEWTDVGRPFWREAGVESRIDLRIQPALTTLDELIAQNQRGLFDFAFLDGDKPNYINYHERLLQLIRPGGLIAVDNTLAVQSGPVFTQDNPIANALRAFNDYVHHDDRVDLAMIPISQGVTLLRVK
jgi:caffeoyl-CoA O-methyltransferase